jgi:hypothetical protein
MAHLKSGVGGLFLALVGDALKPLWGSHALYRNLMTFRNPKSKGNLLNYSNAKYI